MTKKKRFGISQALTRGLSETINVVENNSGLYRNVMLPLSRIELDPENPRKLAIDLLDIKQGLRADDPEFARKQAELERLRELAHTIQSSGIINPIVVYKRGELYRIVAGERRSLASLLAGKQEIEARVFNEKPKQFDLKLLQWVENTAREDLSLHERLGNVSEIIKAYQAQNGEQAMTATVLKEITGLSLSQTSYYLAVMQAPADVQTHIREGNIRNLDKAALLASITDNEQRQQLTAACIDGASLKTLRSMLTQQRQVERIVQQVHPTTVTKERGRTAKKVNMGATTKPEVVRSIIEAVLTHKNYDQHFESFERINWNDYKQATKAFRRLVEILELDI